MEEPADDVVRLRALLLPKCGEELSKSLEPYLDKFVEIGYKDEVSLRCAQPQSLFLSTGLPWPLGDQLCSAFREGSL